MMSRRPNTGGGAGYSVHEVTAKRFEVDHRAALFGGRGKRPQDPSKKNDDAKAAYSREVIEKQNNSMIEDLEAKTASLRDMSLGIGKAAKESNSFLDGMGADFDKAGAMLKSTLDNLSAMMKSSGGGHMCWMMVFIVFLLILMYVMNRVSSWLSIFGGSSSTPAPITDMTGSVD